MKLLIAIVILFSSSIMAQAPDYILECMDCHGKDGVSTEKDIPTIAGASAVFIEETFAAYKYDLRDSVESKYRSGDTTRAATTMEQIVKKLNEKQIIEVADYFSKLPYVAAKQDFDAELAKIGAKVHAVKCEKCHSDGGKSAEEDASILAGQWTEYLRGAMVMIINDSRDVDEKMARKAKKLSDDEWEALLNYYASQQD